VIKIISIVEEIISSVIFRSLQEKKICSNIIKT
jgi:hypothetical protein